MFDFVANHCSAESDLVPGVPALPSRRTTATSSSTDPAADLRGVTRPRTTPLLTPVETANGPVSVWTTFSADQVDLNYANPAVLLRMVAGRARVRAARRRPAAAGRHRLPLEGARHLLHPPAPDPRDRQAVPRRAGRRGARTWRSSPRPTCPTPTTSATSGTATTRPRWSTSSRWRRWCCTRSATGDASRWPAGPPTLETPSDATTFFNFEASHDGIGVVPARGILTDAEVQALADRVDRARRPGLLQDQPGRQREPVRAERHPLRHPLGPQRRRRALGAASATASSARRRSCWRWPACPASTSTRCSAPTTTRPASSAPAGSAT